MARYICDEKYENVIQELGRRGWELATEDQERDRQSMDCQLIWKNLTKIKFSVILNRFVNHFRGSSQLSNKVWRITGHPPLLLLLSSPSHTLRIMSIPHPIFSIQLHGVQPINILPLSSVTSFPPLSSLDLFQVRSRMRISGISLSISPEVNLSTRLPPPFPSIAALAISSPNMKSGLILTVPEISK